MSVRVSVEVVNYGNGGDGPHRAGMAIVRVDGEVFAKLRTDEGLEIVVHDPTFSSHTIARPTWSR